MKKILFFIYSTFLLGTTVVAQTNNPKYGIGQQIIQSYKNVAADIEANGLRGIDESSLDYYSSLTEIAGVSQFDGKADIAGSIFNTIRVGANIHTIISNSTLSTTAKSFVNTMIGILDNGVNAESDVSAGVATLVTQINGSSLSAPEKEILLTIADVISYSSNHREELNTGQYGRSAEGCLVSGNGQTGQHNNPWHCALLVGTVGGLMGGASCMCGVGAGIGFVIGFAIGFFGSK